MNFWREPIYIFTKEDFQRTVRTRRKAFLEGIFSKELEAAFTKLNKEAELTDQCHVEVTFNIPEHLEITAIERRLSLYFMDYGYKVLTEPRKDHSSRVTLTLT